MPKMNSILLQVVQLAQGTTRTTCFALVLSLVAAYFFYSCFYNLYLHPLSHIPSSKWAAIGSYLEFYHDVIRDGQYLWHIEKMHQKLGPIIRINARDIHIRDPDFYTTIYTNDRHRKTDKLLASVSGLDVPYSLTSTVGQDKHRARRGYLSPYFNRRAILKLEPIINERISRACARVDEYMNQGAVLSLDGVLGALSADIINIHFYGQNQDYLGNPDFQVDIRDATVPISNMFHLKRFVPFAPFATALQRLPQSFIGAVAPAVGKLLAMREEIKRRSDVAFRASCTTSGDTKLSSSVLVNALGSPRIPPHERTTDRLVDEGLLFMVAATETTSRSMSVTLFYLLSQPNCLEKLRAELKDNLPPSTDFTYPLPKLEKLSYLTAVIKEGLRLTSGPVNYSPRVSTEKDLTLGGYNIPSGTPVGQISYFMNTHEDIFPEPKKFNPERWIEAASEGVGLEKYLASFSSGSRACIGVNLVYAEMYLTISRIVLQYDFELFDSTLADVNITHSRIFGFPRAVPGKESLGQVRVKVCRKNVARP